MNLYEMIKQWRIVDITNVRRDDKETAIKLKEDIKEVYENPIILSFDGSNDPLFGRGYIIAIDEKCEVVGCVGTWMS